MTIARLRVEVGGAAVVGLSVMTFYSRNLTNTLPSAVKTFLDSVASGIPSSCTFTIPGGGDTIDEATGALVGAWSAGSNLAASGTGANTFTLGSGVRIEWNTGAVYGGHHIRGRTFMVPVLNANFDAAGRVAAGTISGWGAAATTLISSQGGDMVVWSRPRKGYVGKNGPLPDRRVLPSL